MTFSRKNKSLYIDTEALSSLALVQAGLIAPVDKLMNKAEADEVNHSKYYQEVTFPFAFMLAPAGKRNHKMLKALQKGDKVDLINQGNKVGDLIVDETFAIDPKERLRNIYGTTDPMHPGAKNTIKRLGEIAVSGEYHVSYPIIEDNRRHIDEMKQRIEAKSIASMVLSADPLNRAHERLIHHTLGENDMLVIFLRKPFNDEGLRYDIRHNALTTYIENFLPLNKVLVIPFENTYIFAGYNELILDALLAKNYGCTSLIIGENHGRLGLYYDRNKLNSVFDNCKSIDIDIQMVDEYVYCNTCRTLVGAHTCPHGQHHHVHYHPEAIMKLILCGLMPPTVLVRKEISASILAALFPERFENLEELYSSLMPNTGLLENHNDEDFYIDLMKLYQTTSLT